MLKCKHIFRMITYLINAHPVIALMFSQTDTDVLPRRDEGSDKPSATIEPHRIIVPTRTRTQATELKVWCRYHYTTAAHISQGCNRSHFVRLSLKHLPCQTDTAVHRPCSNGSRFHVSSPWMEYPLYIEGKAAALIWILAEHQRWPSWVQMIFLIFLRSIS